MTGIDVQQVYRKFVRHKLFGSEAEAMDRAITGPTLSREEFANLREESRKYWVRFQQMYQERNRNERA